MEPMKTHEELRAELIDKATDDDAFRARLVADPKSAIKEALGLEIPESMSVTVHEDTSTTVHLVLPPPGKLNDADLEALAAGHTLRTSLYDSTPLEHEHIQVRF